jgi:hypothetical protein
VPKLAAMPVPKPTTAAAPAPKRLNFAHLASASASTSTSTGPLLALPTAPAPATVNTTPKTDPAAIDAQWDQAHRRAASYLPFAQAGRDAAARRWDKLMQSVMGRH